MIADRMQMTRAIRRKLKKLIESNEFLEFRAFVLLFAQIVDADFIAHDYLPFPTHYKYDGITYNSQLLLLFYLLLFSSTHII